MPDTAILFPKGSTFWNVEGVPVVMLPTPGSPIPTVRAFPAGKPVRSFPFGSVARNGTPVTEARFREIAGLPAMRPAHLSELVGNDGIPILLDSDPVDWNTAAAEEAARIAAAVIARAMTAYRPPLVSVADDGRVMVLDAGWAASRDASGKWTAGIAFTADDLKDDFRIVSDVEASTLASEARGALH